ncbi:MAG: acyl-CoA dehydrogenase, partial [Bryobacteraceae bacterium]|nr:acyl-CoA dehydrogenase [Bryobacteraceae bacterium]
GYHQDYAVERAYRDSRINRIFEGTNEINRLLATGMLLKRAQRGQLPLVEAVKKLQAELLSGPSLSGPESGAFAEEKKLVENAKKVVLLLLGAAYQKFMTQMEEQQEVMAGITDAAMGAYAMESVLLRTMKLGDRAGIATDMTAVFLRETLARIEATARDVLAACSEGDALRINLVALRRFTKFEPVNAIELRRRIATRLLDAERYTF